MASVVSLLGRATAKVHCASDEDSEEPIVDFQTEEAVLDVIGDDEDEFVDDMVSFDPFIVRSIRVYGRAEAPFERVGMVGPGIYMRITPTISWSWNMAGEPVGSTWYEPRRTIHQAPGDK